MYLYLLVGDAVKLGFAVDAPELANDRELIRIAASAPLETENDRLMLNR